MTVRENSLLAMKLADMLNGVSRVVVAASSGGIIRAGLGWVEKRNEAEGSGELSSHCFILGKLDRAWIAHRNSEHVDRIDSVYEASLVV